MRPPLRLILSAALVATTPLPAAAQQQQQQQEQQKQQKQQKQHATHAGGAAAARATGLAADLITDIDQVEKKMMALARAIPADKFAWRPAPGVRSIGEVFMHVAADNYLMPAAIGHAADPASGVRGDDYKTAQAYERRQLDRDATIAELEKSFAYLRKNLSGTSQANLVQQVAMFGQKFSRQQAWIMTTTHLHEHLGQLIAYARSSGVTPPWSQQGS